MMCLRMEGVAGPFYWSGDGIALLGFLLYAGLVGFTFGQRRYIQAILFLGLWPAVVFIPPLAKLYFQKDTRVKNDSALFEEMVSDSCLSKALKGRTVDKGGAKK